MPKKTVFSKEMIFNKAFEMFERDGLEIITARNLAKELSCSPAPIYAHYSSMNDLKEELILLAKDKFVEYLKKPVTDKIYLNIGIGICTFARENTKLFASIFLREQAYSDLIREFRDLIRDEMDKDPRFEGISGEYRENLFFDCWTYAHGFATFIATGFMSPSDEFIKKRLIEGAATLLYTRIKNQNKNED